MSTATARRAGRVRRIGGPSISQGSRPVERSPRVCALLAGFDLRGRLLLGRKADGPLAGKWVVPGGKVEWGERLADAALREFSEECPGATLGGPLLDVGVFEHVEPPDSHMVLHLFAARVSGEPRAGSDLAEVDWLPLDQIRVGTSSAARAGLAVAWSCVPPEWGGRVAAMNPLTRVMVARAKHAARGALVSQ